MKRYRVIFWDVYGTLIVAQRGDLESLLKREAELHLAFEQTIQNFALTITAQELHKKFLHAIQQARLTGAAHPEIRVEKIWLGLLEKITTSPVTANLARDVALFFERRANPKSLQPHAFETLTELKRRGIRQGIISNAQFYTPIELAELLRVESDCHICSYETIFDPRLVILSCDLGVAKPDPAVFQAAFAALAREGIPAAEALFVGNSLTDDIEPARQAGLTALHFDERGDLRQLSDLLAHV